MNVCSICGYKIISNARFEAHKATHEVPYESDEKVVAPVPEVVPPPVTTVEPEVIIIRFTKPIEVTINGIHYDGKELKVKDMSIASEIVRLAREAYGPTILA